MRGQGVRGARGVRGRGQRERDVEAGGKMRGREVRGRVGEREMMREGR